MYKIWQNNVVDVIIIYSLKIHVAKKKIWNLINYGKRINGTRKSTIYNWKPNKAY